MIGSAAIWVASLAMATGEPPPPQTPPAAVVDVARPAREFDAAVHGFRCRNDYEGSPLPPLLRGIGGDVAKNDDAVLPREFGLCGGMSLAAADFFLARRAVPTATTPPKQDTPLYNYFYRRQVDSLGQMAVMALKFLRWMNLPEESDAGACTTALTAAELPAIVERLRAGQLVPLGLVYQTAASGQLWQNHQVLAYGAEVEGSETRLRVYDPNFPGDRRVVIRIDEIAPRGEPSGAEAEADQKRDRRVRCERVTGGGAHRKVRGVFAMPYAPVTPPADLVPDAWLGPNAAEPSGAPTR